MRARAVLVLAVPLTVSCTLLVDFVDAGPDATPPDALADAAIADGDADADYDASQICKGMDDGWYCGFNGVHGAPPPNWLVHCVDASAVVRACDAGCLAFPAGTADRCDECPGFPNGTYCGSAFATYSADNGAYLISCGQGVAAIQMKCANGCQPGPGDASCK